MTSPLAGAGLGSPSVSSVSAGGGGRGLLPFAIDQVLEQLALSKARKQRQAEVSLGLAEQGKAFGAFTPEGQAQIEKATGRKWAPDEIVNPMPLGQDEASLDRLIKELNLPKDSSLAMGFKGALAKKIATGGVSEIAGPEALKVEQETTETVGRTKRTEAQAREIETAAFKRGVAKLGATGAGGTGELSPDELAAYQRFNNFVPSAPVADQLSGQARAEVMKHALNMAASPNSSGMAKVLAPLGISPADAIGAFALGIGSLVETAASRKAQLDVTALENVGKAQEFAAKALFGTAEEVSKRMGGAFSPAFIASVMEGDPKALATDAGQLVQRFTSSGYTTALTELATKGDPAAIAMQQLLEVSRIPQIASDPKLLGQYSNMVQEALASSLTRYYTGLERPEETGEQQAAWDATQRGFRKKTAGVFTPEYWLGLSVLPQKGVKATPMGPAADAAAAAALPEAQKQRATDEQIISDVLRAVFDSSSVTTVPQLGAGAPAAAPGMTTPDTGLLNSADLQRRSRK